MEPRLSDMDDYQRPLKPQKRNMIVMVYFTAITLCVAVMIFMSGLTSGA